MRSIEQRPLRFLQTLMHAEGDRFGNAQRSVYAPTRTVVIEDDDAWFVKEQAANEIVTHVPECRELVDGEMTLECGGGGHQARPQRAQRQTVAKGVTDRNRRFPSEIRVPGGGTDQI
jgi:hypothetical protein